MTTRKCSNCKIDKELSEFHKGTSTDGTSAYCKKCMALYYAKRYARKTEPMFKSDTHKQCRICREILPKEEFSTRSIGRLNTYCDSCQRAYNRKRVIERHGLTVEEYTSFLESHGYGCYICGYDGPTPLSIDHDHSCCPGQNGCRKCFRGLICSHCNRILGLASDNPDTLRKLADYLDYPPRLP